MDVPKAIQFNDELWEEGFFYQCRQKQNGLCLGSKQESKVSKAVYLSFPLDSGEKETQWHRMHMQVSDLGDGMIQFSYFASDSLSLLVQQQSVLLPEFIQSDKIDIHQKLTVLKPFWTEQRTNCNDIFLFEAKGRYLFFKIEIACYDNSIPFINHLRIEFPMQSISSYLPEFYMQRDDSNFLKRFLGIYQSLIFDLQKSIDSITAYLDVDAVSGDFLIWLSQWVGVDCPSLWEEDKLRLFMKNSFRLYSKKGTKQGISDIVYLYTGKRPIIAENYEIFEFSSAKLDLSYTKLYDGGKYSFYILIEENCINDQKQFIELKKIIDSYKPVNTTAKLVMLRKLIILGQHTYLSINSQISNHNALESEGGTMLPLHM